MATYDELIGAARRADAAGDEAAARRFLELAAEAGRAAPERNADGTYGQPPEGMFMDPRTGAMTSRELLRNNVETSPAMAAIGGGMQGVSYRMGDEALGAAGGQFDREQARATLEANQAAHPWIYGGSEVAGGALSSLLAGRLMGLGGASTLGQQAMHGAKLGAAEGALYGFGGGEGAADRAVGAAQYGTLGAGVGAVAPGIVEGARRGIDKVIGGPIAAMRSGANPTRASRAVQEALKRSGRSAVDVTASLQRAAAEGQPMYTVADDLGTSGQRMLSGISRAPGNARQDIADFLMARQDGQADRLGSFVADALGASDTAAARTASLTSARSAAADVAYDAARQGAGPVDVRGVLSAIDNRIGPMQGSGVAGDGIDGVLSRFRSRLAAQPGGQAFPGASSVELSDFNRVLGVKQDLGDAIGTAVRAGRNNEARELMKVQSALDAALEAASPAYRAANDDFARASAVISKVDAGKAATSTRVRADDTVAAFRAMTPDQQAAFRAGYSDPVMARIEGAAPGVNKARPLASQKSQAEMGAMAVDPELFARRVGRENTMFGTNVAALGGSKTADNLADIAEVAGFDASPLANALTGNWRTMATQLGAKAANTAMGRNTATRELMAQMLLSGDLQKALAPALRSQKAAEPYVRGIEALLRAGGRTAAPF